MHGTGLQINLDIQTHIQRAGLDKPVTVVCPYNTVRKHRVSNVSEGSGSCSSFTVRVHLTSGYFEITQDQVHFRLLEERLLPVLFYSLMYDDCLAFLQSTLFWSLQLLFFQFEFTCLCE